MEAIKKSRIVIHSTLYCVCWFTGTSTGHTTPQSPCLYLCTPVNLLYTHPKGPKKVRILLLVVKKYTAEEEYKETISNSRSEISSSSAAHPQPLNLFASRIYMLLLLQPSSVVGAIFKKEKNSFNTNLVQDDPNSNNHHQSPRKLSTSQMIWLYSKKI